MIERLPAITLTQPWASACVTMRRPVPPADWPWPLKQFETRSWKIGYRGPLVIHASLGMTRADRGFAFDLFCEGKLPAVEDLPRGAVVGVAWLDGCQPTEEVLAALEAADDWLELNLGDYSPGRFAWHLNPLQLYIPPEPIPAKGKQGIWTFEGDLGR